MSTEKLQDNYRKGKRWLQKNLLDVDKKGTKWV